MICLFHKIVLILSILNSELEINILSIYVVFSVNLSQTEWPKYDQYEVKRQFINQSMK